MRKGFVLLAVLFALVCSPAMAQEDERGPITWIAFSKVQPGQTQAAVAAELKDKEFMDGLVADGTILSWGMATPINHFPDDEWNHVQWVTVASWDHIEKWFGAVMGLFASLGAEEMAAREAAGKEIFVEGSHFDQVVRHMVWEDPPEDAPLPKYLYFAHFNAAEGQEESLSKLVKELVVPTIGGLQESGDMGAMGMYTSELHGTTDASHTIWYALPSLGAVDKMQAAFAEAGSSAVNAWAQSVFDLDTHYDQIWLILHLGRQGAD